MKGSPSPTALGRAKRPPPLQRAEPARRGCSCCTPVPSVHPSRKPYTPQAHEEAPAAPESATVEGGRRSAPNYVEVKWNQRN